MAQQSSHDVVKEAQSMGSPSPIDDTATTTTKSAGDGEAPSEPPTADPKPTDTTPANATSTDGTSVGETHVSDKAASDGVATPAVDAAKDTSNAPSEAEKKDGLANGDSAEHSAPEDTFAHHALGEVSGGSDTDISRPGSVDPTKESSGHLRSNSTVKKHAPFKSVSVTKSFLAKSAVSTAPSGPGVKAAPAGQTASSAQPTQKPRLVAKSGSGLGNMTRSSLSKSNGVGSGPDASKVWNKNQPVPPPPPKQFTDEELKLQYGIHLATRLQADESGKEAKWADIDDDEEDWVPENVEWMDGTKSSVATAAVENEPPPPEEPKPVAKKDAPPEAAKPLPTPPTSTTRPSSTTGTKTILKPGAHSQTSSTKAGLVLKGQPEKPTLVAKPSSTAPVKSPWAALPPVEKVSPVQVHPIQPPPPSRFAQRDSHGYDTMPPPHGPAKEIAADDFNRSWRDERGTRELYNSHSGRYEPVNDMRRGSFRDNNQRQQPSLLQRPSHDGPAEPSAAFQTSRNSIDAPAWGRRRGSSNVSGGSGGRLPGMPMNGPRRDSHSINGAEAPARPVLSQKAGPLGDPLHVAPEQHPGWTQKPSPSLSNAQPVSPYGSVGSAPLHEGPAPVASLPVETAVEVQNRLMREKVERARLAKQKELEREQQEEAERKERLRKKLEAMGLVPDEPKAKPKEQSPSRPAQKSPPKEKAVPAAVQSPPKPPVVTAEGEVAQYGMMKVHQPHPVKKAAHPEVAASKSSRSAEPAPAADGSPVKRLSEVQPSPAPSNAERAAPTSAPFSQESQKNKSHAEASQTQPQQSVTDSRGNAQTLKPSQPTPAAWSGPITQQPRTWGPSVWGPPQAQDRALGNGVFDPGYNRGQPRPTPSQLPQQSAAGQAPPLGLTSTLQPSPAPSTIPANQAFTSQMASQQLRPAAQPGPIAPPQNRAAAGGWGNFHAVIRQNDLATAAKAQEDMKRIGTDFRPEIHQTHTDLRAGKSQKKVHEKIGGNPTFVNGVKPELTPAVSAELKQKEDILSHPSAPLSGEAPAAISQAAHHQPTGTGTRASRFFPPRPSEPVKLEVSSGPPPELHPACSGNSSCPVVKIPMVARVRLPPAAVESPPDAPVSMPARARLGMRPLALNPEWQARFNSLLDKSTPAPSVPSSRPSPPVRQGSLAIAAVTKAPLEVRENLSPATVSLPSTVSKRTFVNDNSKEITSRKSIQEAMLNEREFGSLPVVKLPVQPHRAAGEPPAPFPVNTRPANRGPMFHPTTKPVFHIVDYDRNADTVDVVIRLAGMSGPVTKTMPRKRDHRKGPSNRGPKRNFPTGNMGTNAGQNPRSRKPSTQGQAPTSNNPPRSSGNPWTANRSSPAHTSNTWARRAEHVK